MLKYQKVLAVSVLFVVMALFLTSVYLLIFRQADIVRDFSVMSEEEYFLNYPNVAEEDFGPVVSTLATLPVPFLWIVMLLLGVSTVAMFFVVVRVLKRH